MRQTNIDFLDEIVDGFAMPIEITFPVRADKHFVSDSTYTLVVDEIRLRSATLAARIRRAE
jgi:hypothetical protein